MAGKILSSVVKAKLVVALPSFKFLKKDDVKPYKCMNCDQVAIYHYYVISCKHLFCAKCHSIYANKACPIYGCENKSIAEVSQNMDFELGVYSLKLNCVYKDNGCKEIVTLSSVMDHKVRCKFSPRNLLPKLWTPKVNAQDFDKIQDDIQVLKNTVSTLEQKKHTCNCQSVENNLKEEIQELKRNFEEKLNRVKEDLPVDVTLRLFPKMERQIQNVEQNLKQEISGQLNENTKKIEKDIEIGLEKLKDKSKEELAKLHNENVLSMKQSMSEIEKKMKENMFANLHVDADGDIVKYTDDDVIMKPFLKPNIQVLIKKVENIFQYVAKEKSLEFIWNVTNISAKLNEIKSGKTDRIVSTLKENGSEITWKATMRYDASEKAFLLWTNQMSFNGEQIMVTRKQLNDGDFYAEECCLLDQSDNKIKKNIFITCISQFGSKIQIFGVIPSQFLENGSNYVKDDSLKVRIRCRPESILRRSFYSDDGVLFWKLDNFKQQKQDGIDGLFDWAPSECFYTMERGYRMRIVVHFKQTHARFRLTCLNGDYDKSLSENVTHKVTLTIFDQTNSNQKIDLSNTVTCSGVKWWKIFEFIYKEFETPRYLKNDCLLIKVIAEQVSQ